MKVRAKKLIGYVATDHRDLFEGIVLIPSERVVNGKSSYLFEDDTELEITIKGHRKAGFHRKYKALIRFLFNNLPQKLKDTYKTFDSVQDMVVYETRFVDYGIALDGTSFIKTKSTSYSSATQDELEKHYKSVFLLVCQILKISRDELFKKISK